MLCLSDKVRYRAAKNANLFQFVSVKLEKNIHLWLMEIQKNKIRK